MTPEEPLQSRWQYGRLVPMPEDVPIGWEFLRLTEVARLESGHTPSRKHPEYWAGLIPWVSLHDSKVLDRATILDTAQTIGELGLANSSARLLPPGTVVFSRTATVGKATILGREMATSQDFANYICGPRIWNRYLLHLFRFLQPEWTRLMAGSTHNTIYMPVFEGLQVLLPPLPEQKKIAAILSSVDDVIETTQMVIDQLGVVKSAMMAELLTRGLPGRHRRFKMTEIGEVPEEWDVIPLGDIASVDRGKFSHRPRNDPRFYGGPYPFVQTGDVASSGGRITVYSQTLNDDGLKVSRIFPAGTIVITIAANIGDTGIAAFPIACPDSLVGIQVGPRMDNRFVELVLRTRKKILEDAAPQNAQKNINLETLRPLPVQVPTPEEQREIADSFDATDTRLAVERELLWQLKVCKSALMSVLLTGEIRVTPEDEAA